MNPIVGRRVGDRSPAGPRDWEITMTHNQTMYIDITQLEAGDPGGNTLRFFASMWNFGIGSAALVRQHREFLDELVAHSNASDDGAIWLQFRGLASRSGSRQRNLQLSVQRVDAVMRYLVERGMDARRLVSADAWGEDEWQAFGFRDGTEHYTLRTVHIWCWFEDPRQYDHTFPSRFLKSIGISPGRRKAR